MRAVKVGVIGCGNISGRYLSNIAKKRYKQVEVVAIADLIQERAEEAARLYSIPKICTTDELIHDPDVEIVLNLTVPAAHEEINCAALNAGKHVYTEKPFATTIEGLKRTMETAKKNNRVIGGAPDTHYGAIWQTVRKLIDEGWIGKPTAANVNSATHGHDCWHPNPSFHYQAGGGPLFDVGIYSIDALVCLLGPVESVTCEALRAFDERTIYSPDKRGQKMKVDVDTHYSAVLKFRDGTIVTALISWDVWLSQTPSMEIHGTEGSLLLSSPAWHNINDGDPNEAKFILRGEKLINLVHDKQGYEAGDLVIGNPTYKYADEFVIPYYTTGIKFDDLRGIGLADMAEAIVEGRNFRANGELAMHCTEVLIGFDISAREGKPYVMTTTCERPDPIPLGLPEGVFTK